MLALGRHLVVQAARDAQCFSDLGQQVQDLGLRVLLLGTVNALVALGRAVKRLEVRGTAIGGVGLSSPSASGAGGAASPSSLGGNSASF